MPIDRQMLADKIVRRRRQRDVTVAEITNATGIPSDRLNSIEAGDAEPTGDEILILADYFQCDYNYFISSEQLSPLEQTEKMYRMHGDQFSKSDRRVIQEFLFLCECESFLWRELGRSTLNGFSFEKRGDYYIGHGRAAASQLRSFLGYADDAGPPSIYRDLRRLGLHVFRRKLGNSNISGLCLRHPSVGDCILVNYSEDVYRQRFSAAHEAAHAMLDDDRDVLVSFEEGREPAVAEDEDYRLREVRANTFASRFLLPPEYLRLHLHELEWKPVEVRRWVNRLRVSPMALAIALANACVVNEEESQRIKGVRVAPETKIDPEISADLSPHSVSRMSSMLERGLSHSYVDLCFEAFEDGRISLGRLAEMLLTTIPEAFSIANLFGRRLRHAD